MLDLQIILNEIYNSSQEMRWHNISGQYAAFTEIDNEKFSLYIDMYKLDSMSVAEIGFKKDGSFNLTNDSKIPSRLIGIVVNALSAKLKELAPNFIVIFVNEEIGDIEGRKSLYHAISQWLLKRNHLTYIGDWVQTSNGWIKILSQSDPSKSELEQIQQILFK